MDNYSHLSKILNDSISKIEFCNNPKSLYEPIKYLLLSSEGKRLRPKLTLIATELFDGDINIAINPAMAIELFHNFSLLHDDLMDRADMRRGMLSVHKKWNDNVAILSGDAMLIEAHRYIQMVPDNLLRYIVELFTKTSLEVCRGQQYDIDFENRIDVSEQEYMEMIRLKTAVLMACALNIGAYIGKASIADAEMLYNYGLNLGLAFQLKDDLLDIYGDSDITGKRIGGDIISNKKTIFLIKALNNSKLSQRKELIKYIEMIDFNPDEKISKIKSIYQDLNLEAVVNTLIEKYYLYSIDCLSMINISEYKKKNLLDLSENLMYREK